LIEVMKAESETSRASPLRRWLVTEPLVHFMALGAAIFAVYGVLGPKDEATARHIEVSARDLARLRDLSIKQWGREPDAKTMQDLARSFVREEVLYREALATGLDRDDVIVRRRLAQKMEFLANENVRAPGEAELRAYFDKHPAQFLEPARLDFDQVYFSTAARGRSVEADARRALAALHAGRSVPGDNFMLPATTVRQDQQQVERDYGDAFAQALFAHPDGAWFGPVASAHGLHLVRVRQHHPARPARFEDVRERVAIAVANAAVERARTDAYERLLARYTVVMATIATDVSEAKVSLAPVAQIRR
jgi:peptidyl-prolyl cis-trans isomerase C